MHEREALLFKRGEQLQLQARVVVVVVVVVVAVVVVGGGGGSSGSGSSGSGSSSTTTTTTTTYYYYHHHHYYYQLYLQAETQLALRESKERSLDTEREELAAWRAALFAAPAARAAALSAVLVAAPARRAAACARALRLWQLAAARLSVAPPSPLLSPTPLAPMAAAAAAAAPLAREASAAHRPNTAPSESRSPRRLCLRRRGARRDAAARGVTAVPLAPPPRDRLLRLGLTKLTRLGATRTGCCVLVHARDK